MTRKAGLWRPVRPDLPDGKNGRTSGRTSGLPVVRSKPRWVPTKRNNTMTRPEQTWNWHPSGEARQIRGHIASHYDAERALNPTRNDFTWKATTYGLCYVLFFYIFKLYGFFFKTCRGSLRNWFSSQGIYIKWWKANGDQFWHSIASNPMPKF